VRRLVFFYDNRRVFVAYKVIGRDLAIGFRGLGMNEARPILSRPSAVGERDQEDGFAVFYEDLVLQVPFRDRPRRYTASSGCTGFPSPTQSVRGAQGSATELFCGTEGPDRFIEISVSPGRDHLRQHYRRLATDPEIEEAAQAR
jgi:hypothetical protein